MNPYVVLPIALAVTYAAAGPIQFQDFAGKAGLRFELQNGAAGGFHQIELMPGGVAALDYNNDGCTDIFFTNGATSPGLSKTSPAFYNRLFRNNCNGTFTDVTDSAGLAGSGYSNAVAAADYNNDGFADLYVAGVDRNILYRNRGNGTFEDVTAKAGLSAIDPKYGKMWAVSAGWVDADNDGFLDLVVSNYVAWNAPAERPCGAPALRLYCHPSNYRGLPNQIFRNNGDGSFTDLSEKSGIAASIGKGMGIAFADFDGDGLTDIFIANDSQPNFLFHNMGGFRFRESALELGAALPENGRAIAGMGVDFRDYDDDGMPDILVTGMVNDSYQMFRNLGKPAFFDDFTSRAGLASSTRTLTGWGAGMFDFDNDGPKDLFFANAHFPELGRLLGVAAALPNSVFRNNGKGGFEDTSASAGPDFQIPAFHRGAAFADFDNDGRIDVVVSAVGTPARLFHNATQGKNHWLAFRLRGVRSNRDGLGAVLRLTLPGGRVLYNHATTSVGYASSSERLVRFGLGMQAEAQEVEIKWPSGIRQKLGRVAADRLVDVQEQ